MLGLVATSSLAARDAECCTAILRHRTQMKQRAVSLRTANRTASWLDDEMKCFKVPVPNRRCELVVPSKMMCCTRASELEFAQAASKFPARQMASLDSMEAEVCRCGEPLPIKAAAKVTEKTSETSLARESAANQALCENDGTMFKCAFNEVTLAERSVLYQTPSSAAPNGGYPVALMFACWKGDNKWAFQGCSGEHGDGGEDDACTYDRHVNHVKVTQALLQAGYMVVVPASRDVLGYGVQWETNVVGSQWASNAEPAALSTWNSTSNLAEHSDHNLISLILQKLSDSVWANVNMQKLHAVGFSSGGYMASRVAYNYAPTYTPDPPLSVSYGFASVVVVAGGFFYCPTDLWGSCEGPDDSLPSGKLPPTLILHCSDDDFVDPQLSSELLASKLSEKGVVVSHPPESGCGHGWPDDAHTQIPAWLDSHATAAAAVAGLADGQRRAAASEAAVLREATREPGPARRVAKAAGPAAPAARQALQALQAKQ